VQASLVRLASEVASHWYIPPPLVMVPAHAWQIAVDGGGEVRERRASNNLDAEFVDKLY
jgi:hypothetical protein